MTAPKFTALRRQEFRRYFQPSRLVMCVLPDGRTESGFNVITISFCMHCSYRPPMMAIAIQNINESYQLIQRTDEFVLAVPGESLAKEAMDCGWESVRDVDKVKNLGLELVSSETVRVPGLLRAIANVEVQKVSTLPTGDHLVIAGEVLRFAVNTDARPRPLLSVGPDTGGFRVVAERQNHRIALVDD